MIAVKLDFKLRRRGRAMDARQLMTLALSMAVVSPTLFCLLITTLVAILNLCVALSGVFLYMVFSAQLPEFWEMTREIREAFYREVGPEEE